MAPLPRKLAIVGASARSAAFSALRAGFEVVTADLFADADLACAYKATRIEEYPGALAEWLSATECDAWLYTGALENSPELVDLMAAIRPLLGNSGDALRAVRDPRMLANTLKECGVAFPETLASAEGLPHDGSWLCKTYRDSSGAGVWRLDGAAALDRARREDAVFQKFIAGTPAAAIFVCHARGAELLEMTRQLVGDDTHAWRYQGSIGPMRIDDLARRQLDLLTSALATRFALRGLAGVDLVLNEAGCTVIEINPRYTASVEIVERTAELRAIELHVRCFAGGVHAEAPSPPVERRWHAKRIVYAPRDATVSQAFFQWALPQSSPEALRSTLADIPHAGERIPAGRPVLTALASGESEADCSRQLHERVADVGRRLYDG